MAVAATRRVCVYGDPAELGSRWCHRSAMQAVPELKSDAITRSVEPYIPLPEQTVTPPFNSPTAAECVAERPNNVQMTGEPSTAELTENVQTLSEAPGQPNAALTRPSQLNIQRQRLASLSIRLNHERRRIDPCKLLFARHWMRVQQP